MIYESYHAPDGCKYFYVAFFSRKNDELHNIRHPVGKISFLLSFLEASGSLLNYTYDLHSILFRFHTALQSINEE